MNAASQSDSCDAHTFVYYSCNDFRILYSGDAGIQGLFICKIHYVIKSYPHDESGIIKTLKVWKGKEHDARYRFGKQMIS